MQTISNVSMDKPAIYWHADDLGLSVGITQSIERCFDVLNSVSVVVNGTDLNGAVQAVKRYNKTHTHAPMRVVLHINLMEGRALSGKSVICPDGVFDKDFIAFWRHAVHNRKDKVGFQDAIYAETLHQIRAFEKAFGTTPEAVDCHQHMHMIPVVAAAIARAVSEAGITQIRIPSDYIWVRSSVINTVKYGLLKALAWKTRRIWDGFDITASAVFFGVLPTATANIDMYTAALQRWCVHPHTGALEVLFHPGRALSAEYEIWQNRPDLWAYYNAPQRDREAHTLRTLYTYISENNMGGNKNV